MRVTVRLNSNKHVRKLRKAVAVVCGGRRRVLLTPARDLPAGHEI